jgi:glycosyltransferase involved in cell wall biosynthesis
MRPSLIEKTTYLVIGGYLPEGFRTKRFNWGFYKNLKNVILDGDLLLESILKNSQLTNAKVLANFKAFPNLQLNKNKNLETLFRFVFVGRISEGKGIKEKLEAVNSLTQIKNHFEIDFYGSVEEYFELETDKSKYCGFLNF